MIPLGTYLTVRVTGTAIALVSTDTLKAIVGTDLATESSLTVRSFELVTPSTMAQLLGGELLTYEYRATLVVRTGDTYAQDGPGRDPSNVTARVASAFYVATGVMPTASTEIVNGTKEPTIAPASNWTDAIGSLFGSVIDAVHSDVKLLVASVLAVIVILALILGWGPNIGSVASGFRI